MNKKLIKYYFNDSEHDIRFSISKGVYRIPHTHNYWEIMIMTDKNAYNVLNGESILLKKNDICLIAPENTHYIESFNNQVHSHINIEIKTSLMKNFLNIIDYELYIKFNNILNITISCEEQFIDEISKKINNLLLHCDVKSKEADLILKMIFVNLLIKFINSFEKKNDSDIITDCIFKVMKENISKRFNEICKIIHYSEGHLIRIFKQHNLNIPNKEFLKFKLNYASNLLKTTTMTISDISYQVGFQSIGYFNKIFKEKYGLSPNNYRHINNNNTNITFKGN